MVALDGEDPVVPLTGARRVGRPVVEHVVGAERADEVGLVRAAHGGHLRADVLRDLHGERPDIARRPVDQHPVARSDRSAVPPPESLEREDPGMRQRGGLLERQAVGDRGERPLGGRGVLGERPVRERIQVGEHAVARLEPGHAGPDGVDDTGHVDADGLEPRRAQAGRRPGDPGLAVQEVEVDPVGRRRDDPDDDDIAAGNRPFDIADLDDAWVDRSDRELPPSLAGPLADRHDDLAPGVAVVDPAKRFHDVVERVAAVDRRPHRARREQLLQGRDIVRVERLPPDQQARPLAARQLDRLAQDQRLEDPR